MNSANPSSSNKSKKLWIVIGILVVWYAMSGSDNRGGLRGDEAAADAKYREWVRGTVENTWGGR